MAKLDLSALKKQLPGASAATNPQPIEVVEVVPAVTSNIEIPLPITQTSEEAPVIQTTEGGSVESPTPVIEMVTEAPVIQTTEGVVDQTTQAIEQNTEKSTSEVVADKSKEFFPNLSVDDDLFKDFGVMSDLDIIKEEKSDTDEGVSPMNAPNIVIAEQKEQETEAVVTPAESQNIEVQAPVETHGEVESKPEDIPVISETTPVVAESININAGIEGDSVKNSSTSLEIGIDVSNSPSLVTEELQPEKVLEVAKNLSAERKGGLGTLFMKNKAVVYGVGSFVVSLAVFGGLFGMGVFSGTKASLPEVTSTVMETPTPIPTAVDTPVTTETPTAVDTTNSTNSGAIGETTTAITPVQPVRTPNVRKPR